MDSNVIIAVVGITSVMVGIAGTYFVQKTTLERQRKWALEDDSRRIKRELLSKRLAIVEESIKIMMNHIRSAVRREMETPMYNDLDELIEQGKQFQRIGPDAWVAIVAFDSKDLMEYWEAISSAYNEVEETDSLKRESWDKAQKAYIEIIKLIESMRSQV